MASALPYCSFANQPIDGTWDVAARAFTPIGCREWPISPEAGQVCLRNRTISMLGDSTLRDLATALASYLGGLSDVSAGRGQSLGNGLVHAATQEFWRDWEARHPGRRGIFCALRPKSQGCVKPTPGRWPRYTHPRFQYTLQVNDDLVSSRDWPQVAKALEEAGHPRHIPLRPNGGVDLTILALGVHEAYRARDNASRWESQPVCFQHGSLFQPFLDRWCNLTQDLLRQQQPPPQHPEPVWPRPPAVWSTMNAHCPAKKVNPAFRYQAPIVRAGNRAAQAAAMEMGAPVLNWNGFFARSDDTCALSSDGVHVKEWVDLIRARFLLSYLCQGPGQGASSIPGVTGAHHRQSGDKKEAPASGLRGPLAALQTALASGLRGPSAALQTAPKTLAERAYGGMPTLEPLAFARRFDRRRARCPVATDDVVTAGAGAPPPASRRPPLSVEELTQLANGTHRLREYIERAERVLHVRVQMWMHLAANRSCIEE